MHLVNLNYGYRCSTERSTISGTDPTLWGYIYASCKITSTPVTQINYMKRSQKIWRKFKPSPTLNQIPIKGGKVYMLVRSWPLAWNQTIYSRGVYKSYLCYWYTSMSRLMSNLKSPRKSSLGRCIILFLQYYSKLMTVSFFSCIRYWRYLQFDSSSNIWLSLVKRSLASHTRTGLVGTWWGLTSTLRYL